MKNKIFRLLMVLMMLAILITYSIPISASQPVELVNLRTESTSTYSLGSNEYRLVSYISPIHYKDDYSNINEQWKVIDLQPDKNGSITKAPYTLTYNGKDYTFTNKKTNDKVILTPNTIGGIEIDKSDISISAFNTGVKFSRIINSEEELYKASAEFGIVQIGSSIKVTAQAVDAEGNHIDVNYSIDKINNKLTESIDNEKLTNIKYPITIDPVVEISASGNQDGRVTVSVTDFTFADLCASNGSYSVTNFISDSAVYIRSSTTVNRYSTLNNGVFMFDTSILPDTAIASSAILSLYGVSKSDNLSITPNIAIYKTNSTNTSVLSTDRQLATDIQISDTVITYAGYNISGYNEFPLNATGLSYISTTGLTRIVTRNPNHEVAVIEPTWKSYVSSELRVYFSEKGASYAPKLSIDYTIPVPPSDSSITLLKMALPIIVALGIIIITIGVFFRNPIAMFSGCIIGLICYYMIQALLATV